MVSQKRSRMSTCGKHAATAPSALYRTPYEAGTTAVTCDEYALSTPLRIHGCDDVVVGLSSGYCCIRIGQASTRPLLIFV